MGSRKIYVLLSTVALLLLMTGCSSLPVVSPAPADSTATPPQPAAVTPSAPAGSPTLPPTPASASSPTPTPGPSEAAPTSSASTEAGFPLSARQDSNIPGVPAGITEDGAPFRGSPDAPVTMMEYSDFQCPFCLRHFQQTQPKLDELYVTTGKVRYVFKNFPLVRIHPQAEPAAEAALCAGVQGKFWPMHDILFERQGEWAGKDNAADVFRRFAQSLGLDMDAYDACWQAQPFRTQIESEVKEGAARGVSGTPAFFINGWFVSGAQDLSTFQAVIEKALAGERPTPTPTPSYADLHPFDPNPDTPGRTYMGDAYIGSEDAPVVILEISDLQCPYCRRHHTEVWPEFKKKYVDTGRVRVVFKHLLGHNKSEPAAEAAECAGNQGKLFAYADLLYARVEDWSGGSGDALWNTFKGYAEELGLDTAAFSACLDNHEMQEKVRLDHRVVLQANVRGTPTFILIVKGKVLGRVPGFISMAQWDRVMEQVDQVLTQGGS